MVELDFDIKKKSFGVNPIFAKRFLSFSSEVNQREKQAGVAPRKFVKNSRMKPSPSKHGCMVSKTKHNGTRTQSKQKSTKFVELEEPTNCREIQRKSSINDVNNLIFINGRCFNESCLI